MSYCVNCGVELDPDAHSCPLCQTPVINPVSPPDPNATPAFPTQRREVEPVNRQGIALVITAMLLCAGVCCTILNLFFDVGGVPWSLYATGACATLWVWLALPLALPRLPSILFLAFDLLAAGAYLWLIALAMEGMDWFVHLALPIWAGLSLLLLVLWKVLRPRSILSRTLWLIGGVAVYLLWLEFCIDRFLGEYDPLWSLITTAVAITLMLPVIIIRLNPGLRGQVRRRFHF